MNRLSSNLRVLLILILFGSATQGLRAQNPVVFNVISQEFVDGGAKVQVFGLFLANPISVSIDGCNCEPMVGQTNNGNYITCFLSNSCGPVNGQMTIVTANGSGTTGPILNIDFPDPPITMPYMIVDDETVPDSLIHQIRVKTLVDEDILSIERGYFEWIENDPLPNPLSTVRLSNRVTNVESSLLSYDYTDDEFESIMDEIEYNVRVDSTLSANIIVEGTPKKRKRTYFTWANERPSSEYPGYFGSGYSWAEDIDNVSSPSMTVDGDFDVVTPSHTFEMNIYEVNFYELFGLEDDQTFEQTGLFKYYPNYLFTMDQLNGPFPTVQFENVALYNPGGVTTYLEGRSLEISTPQTYKKYMGTSVVDATISSDFYFKNLTDSVLDYETIEVVISGDDASSFSVSQQPATDVAVSGQSLFTLAFTPATSQSRHEATVTINTDEFSYYTFPIIGFAIPQLTVSITSSLSGTTNEGTIPIQIQFSEEVTGFESDDLLIVNATLADFDTDDNITFTANLTPTTDGEITVNLPEASATNNSSSPNLAASEFSIVYNSAPSTVVVSATVFLEGAYNGTALDKNINGSIPLNQPYSINGHSGGTASSIPFNAVDWVLVELREAGSAAVAINSTKVGSIAGFLMTDGTIKATDGTSDLTVSLSGNSGSEFFVVVYHRNHLPIMSASTISESSGTYTIDFTSNSANTYQTTAALVALSGGKFGMPAGDADGNGAVEEADLVEWRNNNGTTFSYDSNGCSDMNLDGVINAIDRNLFWKANSSASKTSQLPTSI